MGNYYLSWTKAQEANIRQRILTRYLNRLHELRNGEHIFNDQDFNFYIHYWSPSGLFEIHCEQSYPDEYYTNNKEIFEIILKEFSNHELNLIFLNK